MPSNSESDRRRWNRFKKAKADYRDGTLKPTHVPNTGPSYAQPPIHSKIDHEANSWFVKGDRAEHGVRKRDLRNHIRRPFLQTVEGEIVATFHGLQCDGDAARPSPSKPIRRSMDRPAEWNRRNHLWLLHLAEYIVETGKIPSPRTERRLKKAFLNNLANG